MDDVVDEAAFLAERGRFADAEALLRGRATELLRDGNRIGAVMLLFELRTLLADDAARVRELEREGDALVAAATVDELAEQRSVLGALELHGDTLLSAADYGAALDCFGDVRDGYAALFAIDRDAAARETRLLNKLAVAAHRSGDQEEALAHLERAEALAVPEQRHDTLAKLWRVCAALNRHERARATLDRLCELRCCAHRVERAELLHRQGDLAGALAAFEELELHPQLGTEQDTARATLAALKARVLFDLGRVEAGTAALDSARADADPASRALVAQVLRSVRRYDDALAMFETMDESAAQLHGRALCLMGKADLSGALALLERAREVATDDLLLEVLDDMGALHHMRGDADKAAYFYALAHPDEEDEDDDDNHGQELDRKSE